MYELESGGWSKKGVSDARICSRIDRVLGNDGWKSSFPTVVSQYLNPSLSDHCPALVETGGDSEGGGRPFRFFNYMCDPSGFTSIIVDSWSSQRSTNCLTWLMYGLDCSKAR